MWGRVRERKLSKVYFRCVCERERLRVCVRERERLWVCECVCVCGRERERERERVRKEQPPKPRSPLEAIFVGCDRGILTEGDGSVQLTSVHQKVYNCYFTLI